MRSGEVKSLPARIYKGWLKNLRMYYSKEQEIKDVKMIKKLEKDFIHQIKKYNQN